MSSETSGDDRSTTEALPRATDAGQEPHGSRSSDQDRVTGGRHRLEERRSTLGYLERIIGEHLGKERTTVEVLTSLLLWRRFLVWADRRLVRLHEGSTKSDAESCLKIARALGIEFDPALGKTGAFTPPVGWSVGPETIARAIYVTTNPGRGAWVSEPLQSRSAFFRTAFGAKADTAYVDPGVALLVKTIPRIGCRTWCSCDGHHLVERELATSEREGARHSSRRGPPREEGIGSILFAYDLDRDWFMHAAGRLVERSGMENHFGRHHRGGRYARGIALFIDADDFPADSFEERCFLRDAYLQKIARALMDDELVKALRAERPRDLAEARRLFSKRERRRLSATY